MNLSVGSRMPNKKQPEQNASGEPLRNYNKERNGHVVGWVVFTEPTNYLANHRFL